MTKAYLQECHTAIKPFIHNTPVLKSGLINAIVGSNVFFKCENFQKMGAYKMRGASNAIMHLTDNKKKKGVLTHSSGNFAQALSLAAQNLNVPAYIVMPKNAPQVKKDAVKTYGGIIIECESNLNARETVSKETAQKTGATFIHPSNQLDVIHGHATASIELLNEQPDLDYIFCPIGGGGLIAGTALAAKFFSQNCEVIGAEPEEVDDAYRSLLSGKIESNATTNTIADGLKTQLGDQTFPIIKEHVRTIIRVSESEIVDAMRLVWERMKIVIEPSSAVAVAALLKTKSNYQNKNIGLILSGGNVDLNNLPF